MQKKFDISLLLHSFSILNCRGRCPHRPERYYKFTNGSMWASTPTKSDKHFYSLFRFIIQNQVNRNGSYTQEAFLCRS